jgi:hypothetical protein
MPKNHGLRPWIIAHPILVLPLIYLGWACLFWTPLLLFESSVWSFPNVRWFIIGKKTYLATLALPEALLLSTMQDFHIQETMSDTKAPDPKNESFCIWIG